MRSARQIWTYNFLFSATAFLLMAFALVPVDYGLGQLPVPDLMFCLMAAWRLRRPEYANLALVVGSALIAEIFFLMPLGLWSAMALISAEFFRIMAERVRFVPFVIEWLVMVLAYAAACIAYHLILAICLAPIADFGDILLRLTATALAYPPVVAAANLIFRIRKASTIAAGLADRAH